MLDINEIESGDLLGQLSLGPDKTIMASGLGKELLRGWRLRGSTDENLYRNILPGWSNGYIEIVPGQPDPGDLPETAPDDMPADSTAMVDQHQDQDTNSVERPPGLNKVDLTKPGTYGVPKLAHSEVNYRPAQGATEQCRNCAMFSEGHCLQVEDPIHLDGVCDAWQPKPEQMSADEATNEPDYSPLLPLTGALGRVTLDPQVINIDRLHYQRQLNMDTVDRLAAAPDQVRNHVGLIAIRKDGTSWAINGQHHTLAAMRSKIPQMHYRAFASKGPKHEKKVYTAWEQIHGTN